MREREEGPQGLQKPAPHSEPPCFYVDGPGLLDSPTGRVEPSTKPRSSNKGERGRSISPRHEAWQLTSCSADVGEQRFAYWRGACAAACEEATAEEGGHRPATRDGERLKG
eukprot:scaffold126937_cov28-Tisochrysis_lutea.AAC.2